MSDTGSLAIVFPGQGSQHIGMLQSLSQEHAIIEKTFEEVSEVVGINLWKVAEIGPQDKIDSTLITQPLLLAADVAVWRVLQTLYAEKLNPKFMAGHSLGEYSALVCAQALSLTAASRLVQQRAEYMQAAVSPGVGSMLAVLGMEDKVIAELCDLTAGNEVLSPANFNSIGQCVVAGHKIAIERLMPVLKQHGAKIVKELPVSVPSHCKLMQPAIAGFTAALQTVNISPPQIPVIQNYDVRSYADPQQIKHALIEQLVSPVRWVETIQFMHSQGVTHLIECGPGQVLCKLNRRIVKQMTVFAANTPELLARIEADLS